MVNNNLNAKLECQQFAMDRWFVFNISLTYNERESQNLMSPSWNEEEPLIFNFIFATFNSYKIFHSITFRWDKYRIVISKDDRSKVNKENFHAFHVN